MLYGLIGLPLGHSFSKEIHESLGAYAYELHQVEREDFDAFMRARDFRGINVTIPYKQDVIPYLAELAVNDAATFAALVETAKAALPEDVNAPAAE